MYCYDDVESFNLESCLCRLINLLTCVMTPMCIFIQRDDPNGRTLVSNAEGRGSNPDCDIQSR